MIDEVITLIHDRRTSKALDLIYDEVEDHLLKGEFVQVKVLINEFLNSSLLFPKGVYLALLTTTKPYKEHL